MAYSRRPGRSEVDRVIERCAGLDVHKASVKACVRLPDGHGGRHSETRTFRTITAGLVLLGDWLDSHQIKVVGWSPPGCSCDMRVHECKWEAPLEVRLMSKV